MIRLGLALLLALSVALTTFTPTQATISLNQFRQTYIASGSFTPVATPTDLITITGSATKIVRVVSLFVTTTNTAAGSQQFAVVKRSALDTTGTFIAATSVPLDSAAVAATTTVGHYTANPGGLGTAVGTINTVRVASPAAVPASFAAVVVNAGLELLPLTQTSPSAIADQAVTLRGAAENLAVNFAGAALVAGQTHAYTIIWTEE